MVLISTYWNVKKRVFTREARNREIVLISTYWNVKLQIYSSSEPLLSSFNLNLLECKILLRRKARAKNNWF